MKKEILTKTFFGLIITIMLGLLIFSSEVVNSIENDILDQKASYWGEHDNFAWFEYPVLFGQSYVPTKPYFETATRIMLRMSCWDEYVGSTVKYWICQENPAKIHLHILNELNPFPYLQQKEGSFQKSAHYT